MTSPTSSWHHQHSRGVTKILMASPASSWRHWHPCGITNVLMASPAPCPLQQGGHRQHRHLSVFPRVRSWWLRHPTLSPKTSTPGCHRDWCSHRGTKWWLWHRDRPPGPPQDLCALETSSLVASWPAATITELQPWLSSSHSCPQMPPFCVTRNRIKPWWCHRCSELGQCCGDSGVTGGGTGTPCSVRLWRGGTQGNGDMGAGVTSQWPSSSVVGQECGVPKPWHCPLPPPGDVPAVPRSRTWWGTHDSPPSRSRTCCGPTQGFI